MILNSKNTLKDYFDRHNSLKKTIQIPYAYQSDFVELLNRLNNLVKKSNFMLETLCTEIAFDSLNDQEITVSD
ncbi:hypothetical protein HMI55_002410 [Coelomomyces lativittatus]|nr:hypothetical protein HMI55_002410 [Coelomomyces lativittatus]